MLQTLISEKNEIIMDLIKENDELKKEVKYLEDLIESEKR